MFENINFFLNIYSCFDLISENIRIPMFEIIDLFKTGNLKKMSDSLWLTRVE